MTEPVVVLCPGAALAAVGPILDELAAHNVTVHVGDHCDIETERIVAVVDSDPTVVFAATARGVDTVVWDQDSNRGFPWHFRATRDDLLPGLLRRLTEWQDRHGESR